MHTSQHLTYADLPQYISGNIGCGLACSLESKLKGRRHQIENDGSAQLSRCAGCNSEGRGWCAFVGVSVFVHACVYTQMCTCVCLCVRLRRCVLLRIRTHPPPPPIRIVNEMISSDESMHAHTVAQTYPSSVTASSSCSSRSAAVIRGGEMSVVVSPSKMPESVDASEHSGCACG